MMRECPRRCGWAAAAPAVGLDMDRRRALSGAQKNCCMSAGCWAAAGGRALFW
jgi:hypothetical protein